MEVDNSVEGFRTLRELARKAKTTVCVEPTGGYELELIAFMHKFDVAVAYEDALRVRQFARAEGSLSKTDTIDAALISRFADKISERTLEKQDVDAVELNLAGTRLAEACRTTSVKLGHYYSQDFDWSEPNGQLRDP